MFNGARLIGPSVAATIIAATSEGWCYLLDGVSFLAVIVALLCMRLSELQPKSRARASVFQQFKEGWSYAFGFGPIRAIITAGSGQSGRRAVHRDDAASSPAMSSTAGPTPSACC